MHPAKFYQKLEDKKVQCELCPHRCVIVGGKIGICGVRKNVGGELFSLVYGKVAASHVDPIEKKPLFHFLPGTNTYSIATIGCNFRCDFCQNYGLAHERQIIGLDSSPAEIVAAALANNCRSISYTYTEPTIFYEFAYDTAVLAKEKGLKNVFVSNGYISAEPLREIAPYLDAINVDVKSFSENFYQKYCGGTLQPVLDTLKLAQELKIWVEITTLLIPGLNDDPKELTALARFIKEELGADVPWHISAFFPTHKMAAHPPTAEEDLTLARQIGQQAGLHYIYCGNLRIAGAEDTLCPHCQTLLLKRHSHTLLANNLRGNQCSKCGEVISGMY